MGGAGESVGFLGTKGRNKQNVGPPKAFLPEV